MILDANIDLNFGKGGADDYFFYQEIAILQPFDEVPGIFEVGGSINSDVNLVGDASGSQDSELPVANWPNSAYKIGIPDLFGDIDALIIQMESGVPLVRTDEQRFVADETAGSDGLLSNDLIDQWAEEIAKQVAAAKD